MELWAPVLAGPASLLPCAHHLWHRLTGCSGLVRDFHCSLVSGCLAACQEGAVHTRAIALIPCVATSPPAFPLSQSGTTELGQREEIIESVVCISSEQLALSRGWISSQAFSAWVWETPSREHSELSCFLFWWGLSSSLQGFPLHMWIGRAGFFRKVISSLLSTFKNLSWRGQRGDHPCPQGRGCSVRGGHSDGQWAGILGCRASSASVWVSQTRANGGNGFAKEQKHILRDNNSWDLCF